MPCKAKAVERIQHWPGRLHHCTLVIKGTCATHNSVLSICLLFSTEKEKTFEHKSGQSSAELHPVIIVPTVPQKMSLRQTQLEEQQPSRSLLQPENKALFTSPSKEVNTVVEVTAQEGTGQLITVAYHFMHRSLVMILQFICSCLHHY